jgi:hypothetical protein
MSGRQAKDFNPLTFAAPKWKEEKEEEKQPTKMTGTLSDYVQSM